jgi:hypothetical protein
MRNLTALFEQIIGKVDFSAHYHVSIIQPVTHSIIAHSNFH